MTEKFTISTIRVNVDRGCRNVVHVFYQDPPPRDFKIPMSLNCDRRTTSAYSFISIKISPVSYKRVDMSVKTYVFTSFRRPLHDTRHDSCRYETRTGMKTRPVYMIPDMKLFTLSTSYDVKYETMHCNII